MGERSGIEWTDSTWNPVTGCTKVSRGCDNCYAHALAHRRLRENYLSKLPVLDTQEAADDPFAVRLWPERLRQPERWKAPRRIFVNSMSDLFHKDIPDQYVRRIFRTMLKHDRHVYQILTKRPARAARFWRRNQDLTNRAAIPAHIWIGTSIEDQRVIYRIQHLRRIPAEIRFLSCEPLIGPISLNLENIDWVIVGGESGANRRKMEPNWVRQIRDRCVATGVPFFFKQWGGRTPKAHGRTLDNETWDQFPEMALYASVAS